MRTASFTPEQRRRQAQIDALTGSAGAGQREVVARVLATCPSSGFTAITLDSSGHTALHAAARHNRLGVVHEIIHHLTERAVKAICPTPHSRQAHAQMSPATALRRSSPSASAKARLRRRSLSGHTSKRLLELGLTSADDALGCGAPGLSPRSPLPPSPPKRSPDHAGSSAPAHFGMRVDSMDGAMSLSSPVASPASRKCDGTPRSGGSSGTTPMLRECVLALVGEWLDTPDSNGRSAMGVAACWGNPGVIHELLRAGASPHVANHDKRTPLHEAAETGRHEVLDELFAVVTDPVLANSEGHTPLQVAQQWGWRHMAERLEWHQHTWFHRCATLLLSCANRSTSSVSALPADALTIVLEFLGLRHFTGPLHHAADDAPAPDVQLSALQPSPSDGCTSLLDESCARDDDHSGATAAAAALAGAASDGAGGVDGEVDTDGDAAAQATGPVLRRFQAVQARAHDISRQVAQEVGSFRAPPESARLVLEATALVMSAVWSLVPTDGAAVRDDHGVVQRNKSSETKELASAMEARLRRVRATILQDASPVFANLRPIFQGSSLLLQCMTLPPRRLPDDIVDALVHSYMYKKSFQAEAVKRATAACVPLRNWIVALVDAHHDIVEQQRQDSLRHVMEQQVKRASHDAARRKLHAQVLDAHSRAVQSYRRGDATDRVRTKLKLDGSSGAARRTSRRREYVSMEPKPIEPREPRSPPLRRTESASSGVHSPSRGHQTSGAVAALAPENSVSPSVQSEESKPAEQCSRATDSDRAYVASGHHDGHVHVSQFELDMIRFHVREVLLGVVKKVESGDTSLPSYRVIRMTVGNRVGRSDEFEAKEWKQWFKAEVNEQLESLLGG